MRGFRLSTVAWSGALTLAFTCSSCSTDSKSDTTGATETDDAATDDTESDDANTSSNDESPADTREAGTSEREDDGASERDESDDSRDAPDDDDTDDSVETAPNGATPTDDTAQPSDPAGDGSPADDSDDASGDDADVDTDDDAGDSVCTQGDTRECVGAGACSGGQICGTDGFWGACDCGSGVGDSPSETDLSKEDDTDDWSAEVNDGGVSPAIDTPDDTGIVDPIPLPPGDNDVSLLPSGVTLSAPLMLEEWGDDLRRSQLQPHSEFSFAFRVAPSTFAGGDGNARWQVAPYEGDGRYCVSGEASWRSHQLGLAFYENTEPSDSTLGWDTRGAGVVGVVFDLEETSSEGGIYFVVQEHGDHGAGKYFSDGRRVVLFRDAEGMLYLSGGDQLESVGLVSQRLEAISFVTHAYQSEDTIEARPFDYCVSNVRFVLGMQ